VPRNHIFRPGRRENCSRLISTFIVTNTALKCIRNSNPRCWYVHYCYKSFRGLFLERTLRKRMHCLRLYRMKELNRRWNIEINPRRRILLRTMCLLKRTSFEIYSRNVVTLVSILLGIFHHCSRSRTRMRSRSWHKYKRRLIKDSPDGKTSLVMFKNPISLLRFSQLCFSKFKRTSDQDVYYSSSKLRQCENFRRSKRITIFKQVSHFRNWSLKNWKIL